MPPYAQARLVRTVRGAVFAVAVDLRRGSPTFSRWVGVTLTADSGHQLFVPEGFAYGYCTLEPDTAVAFRCDRYHQADGDAGIRFSDPAICIDWPVAPRQGDRVEKGPRPAAAGGNRLAVRHGTDVIRRAGRYVRPD